MANESNIWGVDGGPVPHIIQNGDGLDFPPRERLRIQGADVADSDEATLVTLPEPVPGPAGPRGQTGAMPMLAVGSVYPMAYTDNPEVIISGGPEVFTLDLGIPQGKPGPMPGLSVLAETLSGGSQATVSVREIGDIYRITFGIPAGEDGAAKVSIGSTVTAAASANAQVSSVVDPEDPAGLILTFSIPRGATFTPAVSGGVLSWSNDGGKTNPASVTVTGPQGPQGVAGPQGAKGDKGDIGPQGPQGPSGPGEWTVV